MDATHVVTVFLRNEGAVLLLRRSEEVGSYPGAWGAVAGHAEGDPESQALAEVEEETGLDAESLTLADKGDQFEVTDPEIDTRWVVHPFLFDCETRDVETNWETAEYEWVAPTAILDRETVPDLWVSYDRVRPRPDTIAADTAHGSAVISIRALEVLRDEAKMAVVAAKGGEMDRVERVTAGDSTADLADLARTLRDARPEMTALRNRVNRAMASVQDDPSPQSIHDASREGIQRAVAADNEAARRAAQRLHETPVVTLSRSGTVQTALEAGDPTDIRVAESRPGSEGVEVAERLAEAGKDVVLTGDANIPGVITGSAVVLVGADTVLPDGSVINKVGTRATMLAAASTGADRVVVCARDKIAPEAFELDAHERPSELYEGSAPIDVRNPVFERVPASLVDRIVTEDGALAPDDVASVAAEHRRLAAWDGE